MTTTEFIAPIRPTVRAVIFRAGKILVQVKRKAGGPEYLTLPGGKQEPGETACEALIRECAEEVDATVSPGRLLHVAEVVKPKSGGLRHQIELLFQCDVATDYRPRLGHHPDPSQIATRWACPTSETRLFRPGFAPFLSAADAPCYLGVFDG